MQLDPRPVSGLAAARDEGLLRRARLEIERMTSRLVAGRSRATDGLAPPAAPLADELQRLERRTARLTMDLFAIATRSPQAKLAWDVAEEASGLFTELAQLRTRMGDDAVSAPRAVVPSGSRLLFTQTREQLRARFARS
ncbi:hypothetical protein ACWEKT_07925 [Nocardia takedensis]|uniref:hypothetical protein n=1 Tax=Nocardia takedensis TaxID=259390 RepID=UPI0002F1399B|nr:hypothetical protein [Nocardia takedensis]